MNREAELRKAWGIARVNGGAHVQPQDWFARGYRAAAERGEREAQALEAFRRWRRMRDKINADVDGGKPRQHAVEWDLELEAWAALAALETP